MIIVLLADGFEEIEALTPVDMLRRAGLDVRTVGIAGVSVTGAHGIKVNCDSTIEEIDLQKVDMAVFPGGMPGATNLDASPFTDKVIEAINKNGGRLAAICAAPLVFGRRGLLEGRMATCYPGFENELIGAVISDDSVVTDGNITTAKGMGVALDFAEELISLIKGDEEARKISKAICRSDKKKKKAVKPPEKKPLPHFDDADVMDTAKKLDEALIRLGITASIIDATKSTRLTRFEVLAEGRQKAGKILKLTDEIALELGESNITIMASIENDKTAFIDIPNKKAELVLLNDILEGEEFKAYPSTPSVALGQNFDREAIIADLKRLPHMIIGGVTGSGKSMVVHSIIRSILSKATPKEARLILIDPKMVEFTMYEGLAHLERPIVCDIKKAIEALAWANDEVERRYGLMAQSGVWNIDAYNEKAGENSLPKIVIIVDELADLMLFAKKDAEANILRLAQKARAAGIHLVLATQRPAPDIITGLIKANIPTRLCLKVSSVKDSRTILDASGAEKLLNRGDALYLPVGSIHPIRIQTPFIPSEELFNPQALIK